MAHPGLLRWGNSIRLTMASDPGRQVFKDQVQTHGFLFLDDYLDNIVSGAKQDPLIELVKTPGRKKAIARQPKLMSSKLGQAVTSLSFETINENWLPANSLRAPLLPAKFAEDSSDNASTPLGQQPRPPLIPIPISNNAPNDSEQDTPIQSLPTRNSSLLPVPVEHNDLSIIAEDEEPSERSRIFTSGTVVSVQQSPDINVPEPLKPSPVPETRHDISMASASSTATFQSIALESPKTVALDTKETEQVDEAPLELPLDSPIIAEFPETLPSGSSKEAIDQVIDEVAEEVDRKSNDRPIAMSFPTLPEPMPLRKSIKPSRDPSLVMQGAATPGAPISGKRTSWLMKAREVKALETTSKKHVPSINFFSSGLPNTMPLGVKRKSGDRLNKDQVEFGHEDEERMSKVAKTMKGEVAPRKSKDIQIEMTQADHPSPITQPLEGSSATDSVQEGVLDRLKKTVEGFGIRVSGKTLNKSLGGEAATALAEARAAAEARIAERDRKGDELTMALGSFTPALPNVSEGQCPESQASVESSLDQKNTRLSISDLFPSEGRVKEKHKAPEKPFQFKPLLQNTKTVSSGSRQSTSTTPPNSPPPHINSVHLALAPVFNKPPPVFAPPPQVVSKVITPTSTQAAVFNPPSRTIENTQPKAYPPISPPRFKAAGPLTAQSTLESVQSDQVFDHNDDGPAWMPQTQDTDYTSGYTQTQTLPETQICDEDDSWPMDEKLAAGVQWTFGGSKEDSMTWSTLPSQSQRGDTGPVTKTSSTCDLPFDLKGSPRRNPIPGAFEDDADNMIEDQEDPAGRDTDLEDIVHTAPKAAVVDMDMELKSARPQSQMSVASFDSSQSQQSQGGFLNQASKLLSSALGTNKKQSEVKLVLQKAAVAAKKQQEEADKKAARLKEMESRRQQALQRKAEEERARTQEEERKMKDEAERRKKEKEGNTEKRALKLPPGKKDEDAQKKRKIDPEKKPELKKPTSSMLFGKSHLKSSVKQTSTLNPTFSFNALAAVGSSSNLAAESSKAKEHTNPTFDEEISQPSQLVQSLMSARAKAQIEAAKPVPTPPPTENIELPDINSEYSDSEDEDRARTFDPPEWAQSPELRQALENQKTINPDDIFGAVRPLKMEEIFKSRTSRFRARTSSANWTGTDRLTKQEESAYARRMGFK